MNRFRHALFLSVIALVLSGGAHAKDKDGSYITVGNQSCEEYLDAYSRATLTGESEGKGPAESVNIFGYINGYISAYNHYVPNGKKNILGSMSMNDVRRWIASWCPDNPPKDLVDGIVALIVKLGK